MCMKRKCIPKVFLKTNCMDPALAAFLKMRLLNITSLLVRKSQIYILLILTMKKKLSVNPIQTRALRPEGAENMSLGSQVSDICF